MNKTCQLTQQGIVESQKIIGFVCNQNDNKSIDPPLSGNTLFQIPDEHWNQHEEEMMALKLLNQNEQKSRTLTHWNQHEENMMASKLLNHFEQKSRNLTRSLLFLEKYMDDELMKDEEDSSGYLR